MTSLMLKKLQAAATPGCVDCSGDGFVSISWNNDPDRCEDVTCDCVRLNADGVPMLYEPPEPPDMDGEEMFRDYNAELRDQAEAARRLK